MILLCWSLLSLCLSTSAEFTTVRQKSGENVTLECSFTKCQRSNNKTTDMYLYHNLEEKKEVLYYYTDHESEKITPRKGYSGRVGKKGSLENNTVTIRNLTVDDSGLYTCVYDEVTCNVYILVVSDLLHEESPERENNLGLLLIIFAICSISIIAIMFFILLIIPRVKQWISRRKARNDPQGSNDYVYEVMTKNGLRPVAAPEQLSPSRNGYD
ncbi:immunoglobulin V-set domain-containing protein [Seriola aureovittata]|uniref:immunoglobulin V-set domain-containing protein n=1 Tax=Seriola aureovittata TaxID=2871759 RepID=UPI0024BEDF5A|nr:immunoglobulin V-set domain-containing protein [Seriola aureovittata]